MTDKTDFEKLGNFINSIAATRSLLQRAHDHGFLIEGLVLYATLIDGLGRIAVVLKQQIENKSSDFNSKYIHQDGNKEGYYTERQIYKFALEKRVFDEDLFDEINDLYDFRNKVIHQFVVSEIEYSHLELVLIKYELIYTRLMNIVYSLESEQIHKKIGMTVSGKITDNDKKEIFNNILNKIDTKNPDRLKKVLGSKLIQDPKSFSKKTEVDKIRDEISDEIEISQEKRKIPPGFDSVKEITKWAERKGLFNKCTCGHEKTFHVDSEPLKEKNKGEGLEKYIKNCSVSKCKCKLYSAI